MVTKFLKKYIISIFKGRSIKFFSNCLISEDGADILSRKVGNQLPFYAEQHARRARISATLWRNLETRIHLMVCSSLARIFLLERRKSHWELKGQTRQKFVFELDETSTAASSRAAEKQLHLKLNTCSNRGDSGWTEVCYVKWLLFSEILCLVKTPRGSVGVLTAFLVRYWEARRTCVIGTGKQTEEKVKSWHFLFLSITQIFVQWHLYKGRNFYSLRQG